MIQHKIIRYYISVYIVRFAAHQPALRGLWDGPAWMRADTLELAHFRPEGSGYRPKTCVKLLYTAEGIFGIFRVEDRYVRCVRTRYGDPVYKDS